jgi:hypothetical protein
MFERKLIDELVGDPRAGSRTKRIAEEVERRWYSKEPASSFTITDVLLAQEPLSTLFWMHMDGAGMGPGGVPNPAHSTPIQTMDPVVIVALDPDAQITHPMKRLVPVPGRGAMQRESFCGEFGNWAAVADLFPERTARMILWRSGFPLRGFTGPRTNELVVEWRWLENTVLTVGDEGGHGLTQ